MTGSRSPRPGRYRAQRGPARDRAVGSAAVRDEMSGAAPEDRVIEHEHDDRADDGDEHAPEIEPGDARAAQPGEDESPHDAADDAEHDIEDEPFALLVDDLAGDEAGNQSQYHPAENGHSHSP